jgi:hypothetical protein
MVKVIPSNIRFLVEAPDAVFDDAGMMNEFGSDGASTPEQWDRVAGTTEVGIGKSVCGRIGEGLRAETLLKTKVVLEKDVVGSSKIESGGGVEGALGRIEAGLHIT